MIHKQIVITEEQNEFLNRTYINFSKFVRQKIEELKKEKK
jgi:hypothetical protein